jgi:hypothetical protein
MFWATRRPPVVFSTKAGENAGPTEVPQRPSTRRCCRPRRPVPRHGRALVLAVDTNVLEPALIAAATAGPKTPARSLAACVARRRSCGYWASILRSVAKAERETESSPDERNGLNAPSRLMVDDHDSAEK